MLQDCFDNTKWGLFAEGSDLEEYAGSVLEYIDFVVFSVNTFYV